MIIKNQIAAEWDSTLFMEPWHDFPVNIKRSIYDATMLQVITNSRLEPIFRP